MISVNFTNFSILNKSALATVIATFLFLISFGLFSIATAEAGTLPGYDVYNSKMNTPSISLNYSEVARATNNISVLLSGQTAPFTAFSYKINDTIIDMPPKPLYKAYGFVLPTDKVRGFKVGENEIFLRLCSAEGCGDWSQPAILKITSYVADSACPADATQGVCGTFIKSTQSKIVDGKVYPYHYTLLNDPLNSKIRKPNIVSTSVPDSINIGSSLNKFWDWVISDNDLVDRYQIKVNNRITEENTLTIWNVAKANGVYEFNGYKVGDNNVSVRFCNYEGCGPWSNSITVKVTDSLLNKNCWLQLVEPSGKITVKAKSTGTIFRTSSGLFSTDSDLGVVATYLGAPVGSIVELAFNNINTSADKCGNNYPKTTKNGITTTEYLNQSAYKLNMRVGMTVLCTGNDCAYSGQDYSHVPSASTNTNTTTNTTNTGTTNTTNTTNSTILPIPVASQCLGDPAPASQTVTATAFGGGVYGSGPFTTGSDLSRIATYLGASVGSKASLTIVDAGCLNNYRSVTNNGVTTVPWYSTWRGMVVTCTSGCGTGTTVGTNTGNTTVGSGNTLGISGDLSKMSYSELLNVLKTLTDYLNNLVSSSGGTGVGANNTTGTVTPTPATGTCLGTPAPASQTVTANNSPFKFVYGTGPFTTGSDLGKIAAYLGAPVGSEAKLQITDIGCIQNYNYTVQNGVTSIGWPAAWHGMTVICTSGCSGSGSGSSGTENTNTTNTGSVSTASPVFPSSGMVNFQVVGTDMPIDIGVNGNIMVVTLGTAGIRIVDISNVSSPKVLSDMKLVDSTLSSSIKSKNIFVSGNKAYVTSESRLFIVDISTLSKPKILGIAEVNKPKNVVVEGNYAYIITERNVHAILEIWDISKPEKPVKIKALRLPNSLYSDVYIYKNMAYAYGSTAGGAVAYDIRNPHSLSEGSSIIGIPLPSTIAIDITTDSIFASNGPTGLVIFEPKKLIDGVYEIKDNDKVLKEVGRYYTLVTLKNLKYNNGKLYADNGTDFITIDISDKQNPKLAKTYPVHGGVLGWVIDNGVAFIPTTNSQVIIIKLDDVLSTQI